jgi:nondiscriminating glutamyl-tRNA synthetase
MNYIALLGWSPVSDGSEIIPRSELISQFRLNRVNKSPAVFDTSKLDFINRHYMKTSPMAPILVAGELEKSGWMPQSEQDVWLAMIVDTVVPSVDKSSDIPGALARLLDFSIENASDIQDTLQDPGAMELLRQFSAELQSRPFLTTLEFRAIAGSLKDSTKRKGKQLFHPIRAALTMKSSGPELDKLIPMIETAAKLNIQNVGSCSGRASAFLERYG